MAIFEGAGVALVTPFKENGEVNYEKLEEIVEIPEEEEAEQKTELELLIQRIQAIQEELPKHDDPFYEDEKAFSEAAEEHCFQFNEEH